MLVIETKDYLDKTYIKDNIILADFVLNETIAEIENNIMKEKIIEEDNSDIPDFVNDEILLTVMSSYYLKSEGISEMVIQSLGNNIYELENRIVNSGKNWGVIKSFNHNMLQVWGNFSGITSLNVLPTYTLKK